MNSTRTEVQPKTTVADSNGDSAKLLSLLALATGAVAMPQTSNADIVFTDLSANPVHVYPGGGSFIINNLPGTAQIGFHTYMRASSKSGTSRFVTGGQEAGFVQIKTNGSFLFAMANAGQKWTTFHIGNTKTGGIAGFNNSYVFKQGSYSNKYLLFRFQDSTQAGNPFRYGWIDVSLNNGAGNSGLPDFVIDGYAWETTGATLGAGQVPEPTAAALLALGALTLGAKGLRSWRKNRPAGTKA